LHEHGLAHLQSGPQPHAVLAQVHGWQLQVLQWQVSDIELSPLLVVNTSEIR